VGRGGGGRGEANAVQCATTNNRKKNVTLMSSLNICTLYNIPVDRTGWGMEDKQPTPLVHSIFPIVFKHLFTTFPLLSSPVYFLYGIGPRLRIGVSRGESSGRM
jgi:hypothetical protein